MSYQFIHIETYGRVASTKPGKGGKTDRHSMWDIKEEAEREAEACRHVDNPQPPNLVYGVSVGQCVSEIAELAETAKDASGRKLRKDAKLLLAGVCSYPVKTADFSSENKQEYEKWLNLTILFLKDKYGDNLKSVIEHNDEQYKHIHFYVTPSLIDGKLNIDSLHDGKRALKMPENSEKNIIEKNKVYREAMKKFQSDFYEKVGKLCGMTRMGPGRERLSREDWRKRQQQAKELAVVLSENQAVIDSHNQAKEAIKELESRRDQIIKDLSDAESRKDKEIETFRKLRKANIKLNNDRVELKQENTELKQENKKTLRELKQEKRKINQIKQQTINYGDKVKLFVSGLFSGSIEDRINKAVENAVSLVKKEFSEKLRQKDETIEKQEKTIKKQDQTIKQKDQTINRYDDLLSESSREKRSLQNKIGDLSNELEAAKKSYRF